jgi:hypothetical protein
MHIVIDEEGTTFETEKQLNVPNQSEMHQIDEGYNSPM